MPHLNTILYFCHGRKSHAWFYAVLAWQFGKLDVQVYPAIFFQFLESKNQWILMNKVVLVSCVHERSCTTVIWTGVGETVWSDFQRMLILLWANNPSVCTHQKNNGNTCTCELVEYKHIDFLTKCGCLDWASWSELDWVGWTWLSCACCVLVVCAFEWEAGLHLY